MGVASWARDLIDNGNFVVLDTETTGLDHPEAVQIAIINPDGETLLNTYVKPVCEIEDGAYRIHGINEEMLINEPQFDEIYDELQRILQDKKVIIYNADFDTKVLMNSARARNCTPIEISSECAMMMYSEYVGDWNDYYGNYRWQKLPGGDHTALGDCLATLGIIKKMASTEKGAK